MKTEPKRLNVISPDGIPIEMDGNYKDPKEAKKAFNKWKKRFETQGYYSSNNGRIPLDDLIDYCQLIEIE